MWTLYFAATAFCLSLVVDLLHISKCRGVWSNMPRYFTNTCFRRHCPKFATFRLFRRPALGARQIDLEMKRLSSIWFTPPPAYRHSLFMRRRIENYWTAECKKYPATFRSEELNISEFSSPFNFITRMHNCDLLKFFSSSRSLTLLSQLRLSFKSRRYLISFGFKYRLFHVNKF